ncbi:hypothetical protein [Nocardia sp. NPDC004123]
MPRPPDLRPRRPARQSECPSALGRAAPAGNVYAGTQFDYAGATCLGGRPHGGGMTCTSHGHTFTLGTQTSIG